FQRALQRMGVAPANAIYAGDLPEVDLVGANAAGMHAALVDAYGAYVARPERRGARRRAPRAAFARLAKRYSSTRLRQEEPQASPSRRLPSSQSSPSCMTPSPQLGPSTQPGA